jgi:hypothetical protein
MQILKDTGIDRHRRLISKLYLDQRIKLKRNQGETISVKIGREVSKGSCLLPVLLHLYREYLTKEALEGFETSKYKDK